MLARELRRGYAVHFYAGRNGSGKSLCAVFDTMPDLDAGKVVLSTVRLLDFRDSRACDDLGCSCDKADESRHRAAHPAYVPWQTWGQMLELKAGVLLADEVTGVADSMDGAGMPSQVANELAQLRRSDVVLRMTGLNFVRANKRIREATTGLTRCRSSMPVSALDEDGNPRMWRARRLAGWQTYDAQSLPLDDITESAYDKGDRVVTVRHWIPTSPAISAYDTYDSVARIGTVTDSGRCAHCGGSRRVSECSCADYVDRKAAKRTAGPQPRAARTAGPPSSDVARSADHGHACSVATVAR
jgi:hypothetical protein